MGRTTYLVLVRHGERLDEADRFAWQKIRTHETQFDAPLTKAGRMEGGKREKDRWSFNPFFSIWSKVQVLLRGKWHSLFMPETLAGYKQSSQAGKKILKQLESSSAPAVAAIYSSPTCRTLGTAAAIAKEVGLSHVFPAYGLNCCAAAKMTGVSSRYFREPTEETLCGIQAPWPPLGDPKEVNGRNRSGRGFIESIQELASAHGEETVVLVSHREGIWEVLQHFGLRPYNEYCSTHYLWYDHDSQKIGLWKLEEHGRWKPVSACHKRVDKSFLALSE